jgi:hypothetical protein
MLATIVLASVLALAGCADVTPKTPSARAWQSFRLLSQQPAQLGLAEALAVRQCLRAQGFDSPLPLPEVGSVANLPAPVGEWPDGYGPLATPEASGDPLSRYAESLTGQQRDDLDRALDNRDAGRVSYTTPNGWEVTASRGGCLGRARTAVYGSVDNWLIAYYLPQDLNAIAAGVYAKQPVQEALARYRACMNEHGYPVRYPQDALKLAVSWRTEDGHRADTASTEELRLATADAGCRTRTGLTEAITATFEREATAWLARNEDLVCSAGNIIRTARQRATEIVATSTND